MTWEAYRFLPVRKRIKKYTVFGVNKEQFESMVDCLDNEQALYASEIRDILDYEFCIVFNKDQLYNSLQ